MKSIICLLAIVAVAQCDEYGLPPSNPSFYPGIRQPEQPEFQAPIVVADFQQESNFDQASPVSQAYEINIVDSPKPEFPQQFFSNDVPSVNFDIRLSKPEEEAPVVGGFHPTSQAFSIDYKHEEDLAQGNKFDQAAGPASSSSQAYSIDIHESNLGGAHLGEVPVTSEHESFSQSVGDSKIGQAPVFGSSSTHDAGSSNSQAYSIELHDDASSAQRLDSSSVGLVPAFESGFAPLGQAAAFESSSSHDAGSSNSQAYSIELHDDGSSAQKFVGSAVDLGSKFDSGSFAFVSQAPVFASSDVQGGGSSSSQAYTIELHDDGSSAQHFASGNVGQAPVFDSGFAPFGQAPSLESSSVHDAGSSNSQAYTIEQHDDGSSAQHFASANVGQAPVFDSGFAPLGQAPVFESSSVHDAGSSNSQAYTIEQHDDGSSAQHFAGASVGQVPVFESGFAPLGQAPAFESSSVHDAGSSNSQAYTIEQHDDGSSAQHFAGASVGQVPVFESGFAPLGQAPAFESSSVHDAGSSNSQAYTIEQHDDGSSAQHFAGASVGQVPVFDSGFAPLVQASAFESSSSHDAGSSNSQAYSIELHDDGSSAHKFVESAVDLGSKFDSGSFAFVSQAPVFASSDVQGDGSFAQHFTDSHVVKAKVGKSPVHKLHAAHHVGSPYSQAYSIDIHNAATIESAGPNGFTNIGGPIPAGYDNVVGPFPVTVEVPVSSDFDGYQPHAYSVPALVYGHPNQ